MTDCLALALTGGAIGMLLAAGGVALVSTLATVGAQGVFRLSVGGNLLPRINTVGVDGSMLATAFGLAADTGIVFGVLPAFHLSRTNHWQAS